MLKLSPIGDSFRHEIAVPREWNQRSNTGKTAKSRSIGHDSKPVHSELLGAQIEVHCSQRNLGTECRLREKSKNNLLAIHFQLALKSFVRFRRIEAKI
jgi:hypothetical protein